MDFSEIDALEDVGTLYTEYKKNNRGEQITESEFFKFAFGESIAEMDVIRQVYLIIIILYFDHTLIFVLNNFIFKLFKNLNLCL